jgi:hypothetical protein
MLDAVQKNLLLNPPAHRTKTIIEQGTHCLEEISTEPSMTSPSPVVGDWYRRPGGALFEVVAIDRDDATVEVQHFDGTLEEVDLESWAEQEFEEAQAPEDWSGSVDVDSEDYEPDREVSSGTSVWTDPLTSLDRSEASGYSEWPSPRDL